MIHINDNEHTAGLALRLDLNLEEPPWAARRIEITAKIGYTTINAVSETVAAKSAFREAFKSRQPRAGTSPAPERQ